MNSHTLFFLFPGNIDTRTGGYRYDKRIMQELKKTGWTVHPVSLADDFPYPSAASLADASKSLEDIPEHSLVVIDGLAFSVMPEVIQTHKSRLRLVALIHHPLALETGLPAAQVNRFEHTEKQALALVDQVITTSSVTAKSLTAYNVSAEQVIAVPPGTDHGKVGKRADSDRVNLLCVATLTPRKGHSLLLNALLPLLEHRWHLNCAGSTRHNPQLTKSLIRLIAKNELEQRVSLLGELNDQQLAVNYEQADVFVLASFHEGYGMVLDEAIAHGLPIVCTDGGAMKDTVPEGAALVVPANNTIALSTALHNIITDDDLRDRLTNQALIARNGLRTWQQAALEFAEAVTQ